MVRSAWRLLTAVALLAGSSAALSGQGSPTNRLWPPGLQKVSSDSRALSPEEALKTFYMPPDYRVELVASEPLIQEPVALDWDLDGRLWAVEMPGFMADIRGSNEHDPIGRVVVLEDTNGDGRMDKRTVFADHLVLARSLKVLDRGVLVAEPPNVWLMRDTNGDLRMDAKELVTDRYGRFEGDPQNIIEHRISITEYLRDQIVARKLEQPTGYGRIYRVMHETTRRDTTRPFASASPQQLVDALSHPNGWRRDTAQRLLVERGAKTVIPALSALAAKAPEWRTRLHALWTLDGVDAIQPANVVAALEDPSRDVRAAAIRIAERWLGELNYSIQAAVLKRLDDMDWAVRYQLAASIGVLPAGIRESAAVEVLDRYGNDPVVMDATLSGLRGSESVVLERLLAIKRH